MEAPPVQFLRTPDGFEIAYSVCGEGEPFVLMPWPFSHRGLWWRTEFGKPLATALAQRFRLVQYDGRGQGMSTRGLPEDHGITDYVTDLEAVVDHLALPRFVLYGAPLSGHVALRYAVKHPERVEALVLGDTPMVIASGPPGIDAIARQDWDAFLHMMASSYSLDRAPLEPGYWRESINQKDFLRQHAAAMASNVEPLLKEVRVPTLIVNARVMREGEPEAPLAEQGRALAAGIANARLILYEGFAGVLRPDATGETPFVRYVEEFLRDIQEPAPAALRAGLSPREIEVLRLVAEGKTNREIAAALTISEHTVIRHVGNIFTKTGAENRAGATAYAVRHRLV